MKHRFMKVLACLSLVLMVFGAVTPGAFADETGTADKKEFGDQKMMHTPHVNPEMNGEEVMDALVFDTEEEEMEFLVERETESINNRIERLKEMLENIDEIADDNITKDSIEEQITELKTLLADIEDTSSLDQLKEIMEEAREAMMMGKQGIMGDRPQMEEMEFDTEDKEIEFLVERETESINNRIERLNGMLENIDEIADDNITEDSIQEQITELETLLSDIESATTLDELKETLEEYRKSNPQPRGHGGERGPMNPDFEEEVTAE
ncbi:hypothetical protein [uncultured Methanolobus sp.]|uniref:hypothetical protein n=1 Tax=uncultured Methanolobus sp. TaxID=218300 RepID=UPI0029C7F3A0|nr:hypothetical protein [uncultured Methanolobus sp.]